MTSTPESPRTLADLPQFPLTEAIIRPTFTPGESVEILQFTDDLYSWDRAWQPATYVSLHGGSEAHIVQTFSREHAVWPSGIRKATR